MTLVEITEKIKSLQSEKERLNDILKENRDVFQKWINENFKNPQYDGSYVEVSDEVNTYKYSMDDGFLKMHKSAIISYGRGFIHTMELYMEMANQKKIDDDEVIYEGNYQPAQKKIANKFEMLKEDMINKGEISSTIRKYINDDRTLRLNLQDEIEKIANEISNLQQENQKEIHAALNEEFSGDKLAKLFEAKQTFINGEKYQFKKIGCNKIKSFTFKKETKDLYYFDVFFDNEEEDLLKVYKNEFKITNYISL